MWSAVHWNISLEYFENPVLLYQILIKMYPLSTEWAILILALPHLSHLTQSAEVIIYLWGYINLNDNYKRKEGVQKFPFIPLYTLLNAKAVIIPVVTF